MSESIKRRLAATSSRSDDVELRKLLNAALADSAALRNTVNNCVNDIAVLRSRFGNALNLLDVDANVALTNYFASHNAAAANTATAPAALTLTS